MRRSGASSSTRRMWPVARMASGGAGARRVASSAGAEAGPAGSSPSYLGRWMRKVVPSPGRLETVTWPPDCATMPCTVARPRPVPPRSGRVVKNGSKSRGSASGGMPVPVSDTSSTT